MLAPLVALLVTAGADSVARAGSAAALDSAGVARTDSAAAARADSAAAASGPHRIVRQFPTVSVRAPLHDMRSSETVQIVSSATMRELPVDRLSDLVGLKAGVVADGQELHVRGGRAGEVRSYLSGIEMSDPMRGQSIELPLTALRSAEVITGAPDAEFGGALAGVVNLLPRDTQEHFGGELYWQNGQPTGPRYDRVSGRLDLPIPATGLGLLASGEATLDDAWLPSLRSFGRSSILGGSFGWRADNHVLGYFKLAPTGGNAPFALEVVVNRNVVAPYSPMWSLDGWTTPELPLTPSTIGPGFSPDSVPGWGRYRAADHMVLTDDQRLAVVLSAIRARARDRWSASLGLTHARTLTSVGGSDDESYLAKDRWAVWGLSDVPTSQPFYAYYGEEPYFRRALATTLTARADYERFAEHGVSAKGGIGLTRESVDLRQIDISAPMLGIDSLRSFVAHAPGGYAYAQTRWRFEGMVLNGGLRLEYFSPGSASFNPLATATPGPTWSLSPRLGAAYPISTRDVFSLAYVRIQQNPARDQLYDSRVYINNREPLGNPGLLPATVISYQAAVKHLIDPAWSAQGAVFYRDLFGQIGAREVTLPYSLPQLQYQNEDSGHAEGFELSLLYVAEPGRSAELHYTYLDAFGTESDPEGYPFGPPLGPRPTPLGEHPLSWDQRHTVSLLLSFAAPHRLHVGWTTTAASGRPWSPSPARTLPPDLSFLNSARFPWSETTSLRVDWSAPYTGGRLTLGLDVRNLFDERTESAATLSGFPNPLINTVYDDYGAWRNLTGVSGGAYWNDQNGDGLPGWIPVHDPRLLVPARSVRLALGLSW
jgi:hypothetical protein